MDLWLTALDNNRPDFRKDFGILSHRPHVQGRMLCLEGWTSGWSQTGWNAGLRAGWVTSVHRDQPGDLSCRTSSAMTLTLCRHRALARQGDKCPRPGQGDAADTGTGTRGPRPGGRRGLTGTVCASARTSAKRCSGPAPPLPGTARLRISCGDNVLGYGWVLSGTRAPVTRRAQQQHPGCKQGHSPELEGRDCPPLSSALVNHT